MTQYACLGLWAAARAGVEVDPKIWEDVLKWHVKYQQDNGGFQYCPGLSQGDMKDKTTLNNTANAVGSMHIAMLHLKPDFLPLEQELRERREVAAPEDLPKFGILEAVELDPEDMVKPTVAKIPSAAVSTVRRAFGYVGSRFVAENRETGSRGYYYYSIERMAALANVEKVGNRNWFETCSDFLIKNQKADGSWDVSEYTGTGVDTAFAVLFLTRSTGRLLRRVTPENAYGDGLLAGGRGLPDDLSQVDFNGRKVLLKEKPTEPLDILLSSLSTTGNLDNLDLQEKIVEQVQIGNREELIGKVDQLVKLVDHEDATIRQTVVWALGRTGDMSLAQLLINRLSDADLGVMIEARKALCWLSRKPTGFGFAEDPTAELPATATPEQKAAVIAQWHKNVVLTWGNWYLENRPFEDRGDAFEAQLRKRMENLRYGFESGRLE